MRTEDEIRKYLKENAELKAENERLKEKIESYICSQNCYAYKQADKYRQTLQEIKELARGLINGSIGGCEDDIGYMLEDILTKAESEDK